MQTFHDHKLWQDAYMAVMDIYGIVGSTHDDLLANIKTHGLTILATIADALSRIDRRERIMKFHDALGGIASIRSLLTVAWGQHVITDEHFRSIDTAYESLGKAVSTIR